MKKNGILVLVSVSVLLMPPIIDAATYEVSNGYYGGITLNNNETLLMTGGGMHDLSLNGSSQAVIQDTTPLERGVGGIWWLRMSGEEACYLEFSGGGIHDFIIGNARARFSGGQIDTISSFHTVKLINIGDPPVKVPDRHLEFVCRDWHWEADSNVLTGIWEDYSTFDIQLIDVSGYSPVIDNIQFSIVPEPGGLLLAGVGGLALWRKRRINSH